MGRSDRAVELLAYVTVLALVVLGGCAMPQGGGEAPASTAPASQTGGGQTAPSETGREPATEKPAETKRPDAAGSSESKRAPELLAGIKAYDDGKYREASKILRSAMRRLTRADQVQAHKYLAFIDCTSGRTKQCRDEFVAALKIDPAFELEPAEAGHPVWGPIFRNLKQRRKR